MNKKFAALMVLLLIVGFLGVTGCAPAEPPAAEPAPAEPAPAEPALTGTITVGGSTSVYVAVVPLADGFMAENPGVVVESHSLGSTAGIVGANEGTFDIGMSSRDLEGEELGWGLQEHLICLDAIATIVHPDNPVQELTMEQLTQIFTGEITNWAEVGGNDLGITVIIREDGSGTRGAWEDMVHEDIDPAPTLIMTGTGGVKSGVAGDPSAISYITLAAVDETVRKLLIDGVEPTVDAVLAGDYAISRPYLFLTKQDVSPLALEFIEFVLSPEGQQILEDEGFVRVN